MTELSDDVIAEVEHEGETLTTLGLLRLLERHHPETEGLEKSRLKAYAERLADERDYSFDDASFLESVDDRLTDSREWVDDETLYELDGERISRFPARWHEELGGSTDAADYVAFLQAAVPSLTAPDGDEDRGVGQQRLLDVLSVVGRVSRDAARTALQDARDAGTVDEPADQDPRAGVYLTEERPEYRDGTLDG